MKFISEYSKEHTLGQADFAARKLDSLLREENKCVSSMYYIYWIVKGKKKKKKKNILRPQ